MTAVNIVSKWGISVLLVLGLSACGEEPLETLRTIAVVGEGEVAAVPTLAKLRVNVQSLGETAEAAAGANGEKMNAIFDKLEELGVSREEDIVTNYISIDRRWKLVPTETGERRQEPDGFAATNAITVTLRDITEVSAMFDALAGVGAAEISGPDYLIDDQTALSDQARQAAMADARRKAELLAEAAEAELGRVIRASEGGGGGPGPYVEADVRTLSRATPVVPGTRTVSAVLSVTWELR